jgi:CheY-like chemotaxis protein/two-component sensor histidine kinase
VDDLLEVSRISQGRLRLQKSRVNLDELIQAAVSDSSHLIRSRRHTLSVSTPKEPVYLDADPVRLTQVFFNLLTNAAKYTPEGGQIRITARLRRDGVSISVRDNGNGIPTQHLKTVFSMFAGLDRTTQTAQKGMGIGLSLVKSLVELHGGRISARSKGIGQGSVFRVWLPADLRASDEAEDSPAETDPGVAVKARRVLIVEDNEDAAIALAKLLDLLGHESTIARDGRRALQVADAFQPDVILLDIGLPQLNGYEVAKHIRKQAWSKDVVLAAVTGWGQVVDKARSRQAGIDTHVTKPLTLPVLKEILASVV